MSRHGRSIVKGLLDTLEAGPAASVRHIAEPLEAMLDEHKNCADNHEEGECQGSRSGDDPLRAASLIGECTQRRSGKATMTIRKGIKPSLSVTQPIDLASIHAARSNTTR
ncbi:hypothetical protein SAMN05661010_02169 [Modicisalibacter muralis]|uniref:Uncharacterized protein n=1 Tax=Modicisalibacter muralis TaxID=119000 RepID=A0A1G9LNK7_9GAMM|nr:hypothetical protein SAMN05661010_02169 [Halomonas muralis]